MSDKDPKRLWMSASPDAIIRFLDVEPKETIHWIPIDKPPADLTFPNARIDPFASGKDLIFDDHELDHECPCCVALGPAKKKVAMNVIDQKSGEHRTMMVDFKTYEIMLEAARRRTWFQKVKDWFAKIWNRILDCFPPLDMP